MPYSNDIALNFYSYIFYILYYKGWFAEGDQPFRYPYCRFDLYFPAPNYRYIIRVLAVPGFYADYYNGT
jgi:hypothetical protein